ncbi:MAG TPA: hypothetical protein VK421_14195 [Pyrinomonadaceae bacterium]|nr:hypothetical protein [Pyrinomonadaceae bacterium]
MRLSLRLLLIPAGLLLLAAAWLWWNRPQRIDIAAYAPADSIIYLEADDLPAILAGLTTTDAWRSLAPAAGLRTDLGRVGWLGRLSAWTGVGPAESVVLSRAQVAVVVLGFETEGASGGEAVVRPRLALVAETHTGHERTRAAVLKFAGDFARSAYGETKLEQTGREGLTLLNWSQVNGTRTLRAAVSDGYAVVGTDEAAVEACLAVRRGERPSMGTDARLAEMRERVGAGDSALAFGYVPRQAAPRLSEIAAVLLASRMPLDAAEQSGAAIILPQLASRLLGGAAWGFHINEGAADDRYFLELGEGIAPRLSAALESPREPPPDLASFVPADARLLTRYNFAEPVEAWRGLNAVVSSQVDFTIAPVVVRLLDQQLLPYGIESPREFLRAVGPAVATARLDAEGERLALAAAVRDETALRALVRKRFGGKQPTKIGDAELFTADADEDTAVAFAAGHVVTGDAESVRRCLQARASGRTLDTVEAFKRAKRDDSSPAAQPHILTLADDREQARGFVSFVARQRGARQRPPDAGALEKALSALPFSSSETRLAAGGFERRTRSAFGQFGSLILRFTSDAESRR